MVLSGYLNDGARGAQVVRRVGGVMLIQDPISAAVPDMPQASIRGGPVNFVFPTSILSAALTTLVMQRGAAELFCGAVPVALCGYNGSGQQIRTN